MNKPFTILLIPFIFGILISHYFILNEVMVFLMFIFTIIFIVYNMMKDRSNEYNILVLFFALGILSSLSSDNSVLIDKVNNRVECFGTIEEVLSRGNDKEKYLVVVERVNSTKIKGEKIILNVLDGDSLDIGDRILFNGELRIPSTNGNPKLFNYRLNLRTEKIFTTMTIKDYGIDEVDKGSKSFMYRVKYRFNKDVEGLFDRYLDEAESSLMKSIVLGKSFYLDESSASLYRDLGLAHILAVSGLHIGIISGFFIFVFSRLGIKRRVNILFTLIILWSYGYIIGFPTSILRANIMLSILLYSQFIHEPYDSINSLSCAFILLLFINPYYLFNIGFQLSFMASFSIVTFTPRIRMLLYPYDNYIVNALAPILGVQIGMLPIQSYYFNRLSIFSIVANIIFIPLMSLALILGFMMIIFNYTLAYINNIIGYLLNIILKIQFKTLNFLGGFSRNMVIFSPEIITIIMYFILVFLILKIIDIKNLDMRITKTFIVYLILIIILNTLTIVYDDTVELHFIDVGQGDAMLIRSKGKDYLVDTGGSLFDSYDIGKNITLPYLEKSGIRTLEAVFISHFHEDHSQGLMALLDNIRIKTIFASHRPVGNKVYDAIIQRNIPYKELGSGDRLKLGNNLELLNLWPRKDLDIEYEENNMSLVSILATSKYQVLLTGDMEREAEYLLKDRLTQPLDFIKIPHHGSKTSSTEELLDNIRPKVGIISLGKNNMYGHPNKEVIERYDDLGTRIYRTDNMGRIKLVLKNDSYYIDTFLEEGNRVKIDFFDFIADNIFVLYFYLLYYMIIYMLLKILHSRGEDYFAL